MSSNSITGDSLVSKIGNKEQKEKFDEGFERIFGKKKKQYSEDWQDSERDKAIAQNGNTGYDAACKEHGINQYMNKAELAHDIAEEKAEYEYQEMKDNIQ